MVSSTYLYASLSSGLYVSIVLNVVQMYCLKERYWKLWNDSLTQNVLMWCQL